MPVKSGVQAPDRRTFHTDRYPYALHIGPVCMVPEGGVIRYLQFHLLRLARIFNLHYLIIVQLDKTVATLCRGKPYGSFLRHFDKGFGQAGVVTQLRI